MNDDWLQTMSASKIAAVVGLSPYDSRFSLWHRMAGLLAPEPEKKIYRRGHFLEPAVLAWFRAEHPDWTVTAAHDLEPDQWVTLPDGRRHPQWVHLDDPRFTASPDGEAITDTGEVVTVEVKTASADDEWGTAGTDQVPVGYRAQVQWQMFVRGTSRTYVAMLGPFLDFREYVVHADADDQAFLAEQAAAFLNSLPGQPGEQRPDIDNHGATYEAVRQIHSDIDARDVEVPVEVGTRYLAAITADVAARAELVGAKASLLDHMGNARRALLGPTPIARRQPGRGGSVSLYTLKDTA